MGNIFVLTRLLLVPWVSVLNKNILNNALIKILINKRGIVREDHARVVEINETSANRFSVSGAAAFVASSRNNHKVIPGISFIILLFKIRFRVFEFLNKLPTMKNKPDAQNP